MNEPTIEAQPGWPEWARWYAADWDDFPWFFEHEPIILYDEGAWSCWGKYQHARGVNINPEDWTKSKRRIIERVDA